MCDCVRYPSQVSYESGLRNWLKSGGEELLEAKGSTDDGGAWYGYIANPFIMLMVQAILAILLVVLTILDSFKLAVEASRPTSAHTPGRPPPSLIDVAARRSGRWHGGSTPS
jgi:hypothetical protein